MAGATQRVAAASLSEVRGQAGDQNPANEGRQDNAEVKAKTDVKDAH